MSVTNTNKQTIVCMKKNKHNELNTFVVCHNKTSVLSSNDRF